MREAVPARDHGSGLSEPASILKHFWLRLRAPKRHASRSTRRGRRLAPRLAAAFFVTVSALILVNALAWQKNRHSAPLLFSRTVPAPPAKEPKTAETFAAPAPRRAQPGFPQDESGKRPQQDAPQTRANVSTGAPQDQISAILHASSPSPPPSKPAPSAANPPAPDKSVRDAQRALVKLGFVLKADGVAGTATRKAIARYERDHGLPVRGQLTPALMQRLCAEAGIPSN